MIDKSIIFATISHGNQKRKGTEIPYIIHLLESGVIASNLSTVDGKVKENIICAAILHDICEDAHIKYETLKEMFNERVADLVKYQSEDKSKSWKERKQHTIDFLKENKDIEIKIVSLADKLSNIRSINKDYEAIGDKLWQRFNIKDKNEHKWYYKSLVECFKELENHKEYIEFKELVTKVFK